MSAILSADDLNDFISPGVACIKPVETLPLQNPSSSLNPYEVTTEEKLAQEQPPPAQITLTDCLACSGCVTSAEAILVSLQSHAEVLTALDSSPALELETPASSSSDGTTNGTSPAGENLEHSAGRIFVASVSPQVRASLAATYGVSEPEAGWMIEQLLCGSQGIGTGGKYGNRFTWIVDTNAMREASLVMGAEETWDDLAADPRDSSDADGVFSQPHKPILSSACPGWICYAEKTHPHVLPHLSRLKSPQALTGTLIKTVLSRRLNIHPRQIWHLAVMPCFDKKLEASRQELTDAHWLSPGSRTDASTPVRDVDCVITAREVLMLAETRGVSFPALPREPWSSRLPFPDPLIWRFLASPHHNRAPSAGTSGGYLQYILKAQQAKRPGSIVHTERGRNADVIYYTVVQDGRSVFRAARFYGFRNIQNLVRKLRPAKTSRMPGSKFAGARKAQGASTAETSLDFVEVMACPGGCTNGGGQIKVEDLGPLQGMDFGAQGHKAWLAKVDEAYFSMDSENDDPLTTTTTSTTEEASETTDEALLIAGVSTSRVKRFLAHWASSTQLALPHLLFTTYRKVESDVGKPKGTEVERVADLAGKIGGGW